MKIPAFAKLIRIQKTLQSTRKFPIWNTTKQTTDMNKYELKNVINNKNLEHSLKLHGA